MHKIVAVHKIDGAIASYKLDNGVVLNKDEIISETKKGRIEGCSLFTTRAGTQSIRSDRGQDNYSLADLPEF